MILQYLTGLTLRTFVPLTNAPGAGYKLWTYQGGSFSTLLATYTDAAGGTPNTNPVIFDSNGEPVGAVNIALLPQAYNFKLTDADDNVIETRDNFFLAGSEVATAIVDTVAAMRALDAGSSSYVVTLGYNNANDGCGQTYDYDPTSTLTDNGITVIIPNSIPGTGRYILRYTGALDSRAAGLQGNLQDIASAVTAISNAITSLGVSTVAEVYFPAGTYSVTADFTMPDNIIPVVDDGAVFQIDSGATLGYKAMVHGPFPLFIGDGSAYAYSSKTQIYAEWYGVSSSSTDNFGAISKLISNIQSETQPIIFPDVKGYQCASDPGILSYLGPIYNYSDIYLTATPATIYLKQGIHYQHTHSIIEAEDGHFAANLAVDGDVAVGGNISIGGTFSASSLAASAGDVTAAGNVVASGAAVGGTGVVATTGDVYATNGNVVSHVDVISQTGSLKAQIGLSGTNFKAGGIKQSQTLETTSVGSGATTLGTGTIQAGALQNDGDTLEIYCTGRFANNANGKTLNFTWAGTSIGNITSVAAYAGYEWTMWCKGRYILANTIILFTTEFLISLPADGTAYRDIKQKSSSILTNINRDFVIAGTGVANGDITCDFMDISFFRGS